MWDLSSNSLHSKAISCNGKYADADDIFIESWLPLCAVGKDVAWLNESRQTNVSQSAAV